MKRLTFVAGGLVAAAALTVPAGAAPPPPNPVVNASFEQGFTGWTQTIPAGAEQTIVNGQVRPGGGLKFARLKTDGPGNPSAVGQIFNATAGTKITGFARFNDAEGGSCFFIDSAAVMIDGNAVFQADSCSTSSTGGLPWSYTLTTSGAHTIIGFVQNGVDSAVDSTLDMDAPLVMKLTP